MATTRAGTGGLAGIAANGHDFPSIGATLCVRIFRIVSLEEILFKLILALAALVSLTASSLVAGQPAPAGAPPSPIKRTILQKVDVPTANYETITGIAEISPNVNIGRHTHFGPETGYVMDGELVLLVDGKPAQALKTGDSYQIPPGAPHDARSGEKGAKVLAVYVVEKGKPLATPAP
jgi:quercetin dioxygenase-like cupin family protein